jgi:hypothetical protein
MPWKVTGLPLIGIALLSSGIVLAPRICNGWPGYNYKGDSLKPGSSLQTDDALLSASGEYTLVMQEDCNLVLYRNGRPDLNSGEPGPAEPLWATNTGLHGDCHADMQKDDGNFVVYSGSHEALWDSRTDGEEVSGISMQNDGNLVIYSPAGRVLWDRYNGRKGRGH